MKTRAGTDGDRRVEGTITGSDGETVTVQDADGVARTLRYDEIERARTVFVWGPAPKDERKAKT